MAFDARDKYIYRPLPDPEKYIRLLVLKPAAHFEDPIVCDIDVVRLASLRESLSSISRLSQNNYAALSYSWGMNDTGDSSANHNIALSGKSLAVTQNLFEALRRLRPTTSTSSIQAGLNNLSKRLKLAKYAESERIWVDAICINQVDLAERSSQVSIMDKIYRQAARLIIWLGEGPSAREDRAILAALKCMSNSADNIYQRRKSNLTHDFRWRSHTRTEEHTWQNSELAPVSLCSLDIDAANKHDAHSIALSENAFAAIHEMTWLIHRLVSRRYFRRRWIIQEIYYGRRHGSCEIYWGPVRCSHQTFVTGLERMTGLAHFVADRRLVLSYRHSIPDTKVITRVSKLVELNWRTNDDTVKYWWDGHRKPSNLTLLRAFTHFQSYECQDPRDILFAVSSLDPIFGLRPDYTASLAEVFITFARMLIEKDECLVVLSNLDAALQQSRGIASGNVPGWESPNTQRLDLPSWVPDLRGGFSMPKFASACEEAVILPGNILQCRLPCAAKVIEDARIIDGKPYIGVRKPLNDESSEFEDTLIPIDELQGAVPAKVDKDDAMLRAGDHICHLVRSSSYYATPKIILRPTESDPCMFTIVNAINTEQSRYRKTYRDIQVAAVKWTVFKIK